MVSEVFIHGCWLHFLGLQQDRNIMVGRFSKGKLLTLWQLGNKKGERGSLGTRQTLQRYILSDLIQPNRARFLIAHLD
jgi:hypothetical protein